MNHNADARKPHPWAKFARMISSITLCFYVSTPSANTQKYAGTGFFVTSDGFFVTAFHVVEDSDKITLLLPGRQTITAVVAGVDKANDLAVLKASGSFPAIPVARSTGVRRGDEVLTVGYPNLTMQGIEPKVTHGIVNSLSGTGNDPRTFQVDLPVQPGNSGGPIVSANGSVVGVVASQLDSATAFRQSGALPQNVNYAIKSNYLLELLATIPGANKRLPPAAKVKSASLADLAALVEPTTALVVAERRLPVSPNSTTQDGEDHSAESRRRANASSVVLAGVRFRFFEDQIKVDDIRSEAQTTMRVGDVVLQCFNPVTSAIRIESLEKCKATYLRKGSRTTYMFRVSRNGEIVVASIVIRDNP